VGSSHRWFTAKNAKNAKNIAKGIAFLTHRTIARRNRSRGRVVKAAILAALQNRIGGKDATTKSDTV